jgi:hypothetical protein
MRTSIAIIIIGFLLCSCNRVVVKVVYYDQSTQKEGFSYKFLSENVFVASLPEQRDTLCRWNKDSTDIICEIEKYQYFFGPYQIINDSSGVFYESVSCKECPQFRLTDYPKDTTTHRVTTVLTWGRSTELHLRNLLDTIWIDNSKFLVRYKNTYLQLGDDSNNHKFIYSIDYFDPDLRVLSRQEFYRFNETLPYKTINSKIIRRRKYD